MGLTVGTCTIGERSDRCGKAVFKRGNCRLPQMARQRRWRLWRRRAVAAQDGADARADIETVIAPAGDRMFSCAALYTTKCYGMSWQMLAVKCRPRRMPCGRTRSRPWRTTLAHIKGKGEPNYDECTPSRRWLTCLQHLQGGRARRRAVRPEREEAMSKHRSVRGWSSPPHGRRAGDGDSRRPARHHCGNDISKVPDADTSLDLCRREDPPTGGWAQWPNRSAAGPAARRQLRVRS